MNSLPASPPWLSRAIQLTRWSLVRRAGSKADGTAPDMEAFCRAYWYPLYSFLRHKRYSHEEAQDHVQSFLAGLTSGDLLAQADPERGRLRNFLMTLLERHAISQERLRLAQKRGGRIPHQSFDWKDAELKYLNTLREVPTPEDACRRALAIHLIHVSMAAIRESYARSGKSDLCEALIPALEGPLTDSTYAATAARLGMKPATMRMASIRFRDRFRIIVREQAAVILGMPEGPQLDEEILHLLAGEISPLSV